MTFTGTLIEDLMATVERAEAKAQDIGAAEIEPWFASFRKTQITIRNFLEWHKS